MLIIDASSGKKTFEEVLKEHDLILSREIINCVCDAIDLDVPKILVAIIKAPNDREIDITSSRSYYKDALQKNMKALIKNEEYELCAKAKRYIDSLNLLEESLQN
jgi:hypothetical protein